MRITRNEECPYKGQIIFNYNLKVIAVILGIIAAVFVGYLLVQFSIWSWNAVIVPSAMWVWDKIWWIVGILLAGLLLWWAIAKDFFQRLQSSIRNHPSVYAWLLGIALLIAVIALLVSMWPKSDPVPVTEPQATTAVVQREQAKNEFCEEVFKKYVVNARVYLDYSPNNKFGLVFVNGRKAGKQELSVKTYDEMIKIVSDDWFEWTSKLPVFSELSNERKAVVILIAMRFGEKRFMTSQFYAALQEDREAATAKKIIIENVDNTGSCKPGSVNFRSLEPIKYTWMLQSLWNNPDLVTELEDMPHHSYLSFNAAHLYKGVKKQKGGWTVESWVPRYPAKWRQDLMKSNGNKTPLELLK